MYLKGLGTEKNYFEALNWFRKAAEQGVLEAQSNIGYIYENGFGVPKDIIRAYAWGSIALANGYDAAKIPVNALKARMNSQQLNKANMLIKEINETYGKKDNK
ncbi:MAG: Sel1 domain protein repeat-containing protein [Gammaproteobacteria bacterium]|nr:Sel1 domain protein repeat-containing protein [Gammaproteobacteria bacterium]